MKIGDRIKHRRIELGMSQDELARRLGYRSRSSINKIEKDASGLPQTKIAAIASVLQTTPSYIMGWEEMQKKNMNDAAPVTQAEEYNIMYKGDYHKKAILVDDYVRNKEPTALLQKSRRAIITMT